MKRTRLISGLLWIAFVVTPASYSQETPSGAELVTQYLRQDIFLQPGVGLKKVSLGNSFDEVLQAWGQPSKKGREGVVNDVWVYEIADHTEIRLKGVEQISTIEIRGKINSPYLTSEGAQLGMALYQVTAIYGSAELKSEQLNYPNRGVGFDFNNGQVIAMRVFQPK